MTNQNTTAHHHEYIIVPMSKPMQSGTKGDDDWNENSGTTNGLASDITCSARTAVNQTVCIERGSSQTLWVAVNPVEPRDQKHIIRRQSRRYQ